MTHKEKCSVMKQMRKKIADKLGIDLHQTECTYEGECSGTCPRCAKEEKILNKALLSGAVVASSIALCACGVSADTDSGNHKGDDKDRDSKKSAKKGSSGKTKNGKNNGIFDSLFGSDEKDDEVWAGGLEMDPDYYQIAGDESGPGDDEIEVLAGDVAMEAWSYDELCAAASNYTGAPICEVDSMNDNGMIVIHCYEIIDDGDNDVQESTVDWITVDQWSGNATNSEGEEFYLIDYLE